MASGSGFACLGGFRDIKIMGGLCSFFKHGRKMYLFVMTVFGAKAWGNFIRDLLFVFSRRSHVPVFWLILSVDSGCVDHGLFGLKLLATLTMDIPSLSIRFMRGFTQALSFLHWHSQLFSGGFANCGTRRFEMRRFRGLLERKMG